MIDYQLNAHLQKIRDVDDKKRQEIIRRMYQYITHRLNASLVVLESFAGTCYSKNLITMLEKKGCSLNANKLLDIQISRPENIYEFINLLATLQPFKRTIIRELGKAILSHDTTEKIPAINNNVENDELIEVVLHSQHEMIRHNQTGPWNTESNSKSRDKLRCSTMKCCIAVSIFIVIVGTLVSCAVWIWNLDDVKAELSTFEPLSKSTIYAVASTTTTFHHPITQPKPGLVVDLSDSGKYYQAKICNNERITIFVDTPSLSSSTAWTHYIPQCSENIIGLDIIGPILMPKLAFLLTQFLNIQILKISNINEDLEFLLGPENVALTRLIYMEVQNMTECKGFYDFFSKKVSTPNLSVLNISNAIVTAANEQSIIKIAFKNLQLETFTFKGKICDSCDTFTKNDVWSGITTSFEIIPFQSTFPKYKLVDLDRN